MSGAETSKPPVSIHRSEGLVELRMARPATRNALDAAMVAALEEAVIGCESMAGLRAVLISAEGPTFTVGGELKGLGSPPTLEGLVDDLVIPYHRALTVLAGLEAPVVCAVQGAVAGGGLGLLWASDIVVAAENTRFVPAFTQIGLSGDGGSSWYLPRIVGLRRALEMMVGGRELDAHEARDWGLVTRVVPATEFAADAKSTAHALASGPTVAMAHMRRMLRRAMESDLEEGLHEEAVAMRDCFEARDAKEGIAAFLGKSAPRFRGANITRDYLEPAAESGRER